MSSLNQRTLAALERRITAYEQSLLTAKCPQGFHKPGSRNRKKGAAVTPSRRH